MRGDAGGTGGTDDEDARDVRDPLSRATAGLDLAAPWPRDRRLPARRAASPSMRRQCVGNRKLSGTPGLGAQDLVPGSFRRGTHSAPGRWEGRRGDDRLLGGAERTRRLPDPMAARGGPHHLGPGGWNGPSRAPRTVSRRAAPLETTTRGARGTQLAVVAPLPPEAHGKAGACPPGRLRGRLLRISPEHHDGGCEPVPRNCAKHIRATSESGGAPCDPRHASPRPDATGSSRNPEASATIRAKAVRKRSENCSSGRARGSPKRRWLPPRWRIREIPPSGVHGPARPEWNHSRPGRPARQGFNPGEAIRAVMATKKKRSKKAAKKKA